MKVNWPLVGIGAGALATAGIIVAIFTSGGSSVAGTGILTVDQLAVPSPSPTGSTVAGLPATELRAATIEVRSNGCFDVAFDDGTTAWAIWPTATTQDADHVVLPDGTRVGDGDVVRGAWTTRTKTDYPVLVGDGGPASLAEFCAGKNGGVAALDTVTSVD